MAILKPDSITNLGGVTVNEYLLTKHNPNKIAMPSGSMEGRVIGVTMHNTSDIVTASGTTASEQYTRATVNGNMNDVRVHFYVDSTCAWQNLPLTLPGWHAADGSGDGNMRTIAIECIMSDKYNSSDKKSEDNAAKLAAALLKKYGLGIDHLYTHNHWYSKKYCPAYILPHWDKFKALVQSYLNSSGGSASTASGKPTSSPSTEKNMYRIRKTWVDAKSQVGAYENLENARKACTAGYTVFDNSGKAVYSNAKSYAKGTEVRLNNTTLYASATAETGIKRSGTYYLYDGQEVNGRMRITNSKANCDKMPTGMYVTGWVKKSDI